MKCENGKEKLKQQIEQLKQVVDRLPVDLITNIDVSDMIVYEYTSMDNIIENREFKILMEYKRIKENDTNK